MSNVTKQKARVTRGAGVRRASGAIGARPASGGEFRQVRLREVQVGGPWGAQSLSKDLVSPRRGRGGSSTLLMSVSSALLTAVTSHVVLARPSPPARMRVAYSPRCFVPLDEATLPADILQVLRDNNLTLGIPEEDDVPAVASLLVRCFYESVVAPIKTPETPVKTATPTTFGAQSPSRALDQTTPVPEPPDNMPPHLVERWRTTSRGLHWRLGARLQPPYTSGETALLEASLESSLLLVARSTTSNGESPLVSCVEISLRPLDGRLPGEFAVPAVFQLHTDELGAYVSNLCVLPDQRRCGIASAVLRACEWTVRRHWRLDEVYLHLDLRNQPAARLYADYEPLPEYDEVCKPPTPPPRRAGDELGDDIAWRTAAGARNRYYRRRWSRF